MNQGLVALVNRGFTVVIPETVSGTSVGDVFTPVQVPN